MQNFKLVRINNIPSKSAAASSCDTRITKLVHRYTKSPKSRNLNVSYIQMQCKRVALTRVLFRNVG